MCVVGSGGGRGVGDGYGGIQRWLGFLSPREMIKHLESHQCAADNVPVLLHQRNIPHTRSLHICT